MNFQWLKSYMPRSLFGRSLLMILFPVVVLQLVVGFVFIQRHFAQVTTQMASSVALELKYAADLVEEMDSAEEARAVLFSLERPFNIELELELGETVSPEVRFYFYDVSGRALIASLRNDIERTIAIDLTGQNETVLIDVQTARGVLHAKIPRIRVSATNPHQLLVWMLLTATIMTIISILFLRNQVRPIRWLAEASEAFGKGRVVPFSPSGATEVRRAGASFLAMRGRLERQIEKRTQMLSSVSHDLRTPLTRLKLSLEMLGDGEEIHLMQQDVEDMEQMLDVFLSFARGDSLEETTSVNPQLVIDKVVADCQRSGGEVRFVFDNQTPKSSGMNLRSGAVSRAITNLLSNALRHGEQVTINATLCEKRLKVVVEDDGPGIPQTERENALKPFVRLDQSRNQDSSGGVGLGLAIVADVARSHGGTVRLSKSEKLGGLKVIFTIPR
ncbi:MAG: two-component sensor histidine kinase [Rhodobacteraceae bacterium]|nr:two-component sensor histidine kinase [Paracoccaceae bacterium]